jgi:hypothetical protein
MNSTDAGMTIELSEEHFDMTDASILTTFGPNDKTLRLPQALKQDLLIVVTNGGTEILRKLQREKARSPISCKRATDNHPLKSRLESSGSLYLEL